VVVAEDQVLRLTLKAAAAQVAVAQAAHQVTTAVTDNQIAVLAVEAALVLTHQAVALEAAVDQVLLL
jgi:hypothetical protein